MSTSDLKSFIQSEILSAFKELQVAIIPNDHCAGEATLAGYGPQYFPYTKHGKCPNNKFTSSATTPQVSA